MLEGGLARSPGVQDDLHDGARQRQRRVFLDGAGDLLGTEERALLTTAARVITFEQAVRFLTDYLDGDRYYRVADDRPAHNLERARAQIALLEGLERV